MNNRRAILAACVILFALVGIASSYAQIGPRMAVSFLVNNQATDRDDNRYIVASQTGDVVFTLEPSTTVAGPWSCNIADTGIIIDSIQPTPQGHSGNGFIFAPTQQVRFMFHAAPYEFYDRNVIGCSTQTTTGQLLSNYVFFRVAHAQNFEPLIVHDAPLGGTVAYPAP